MKVLLLSLTIGFIFYNYSLAQDVTCEELVKYVEDEGYVKGTVTSIQLFNSSWLKEVKAYSIDNTIVVIAEVKKDEWGFNTEKYAFCGIPSSNWDAFYSGLYDLGKTYGEKFHKYIYNYNCNCN
jgi:hypothetical protein